MEMRHPEYKKIQSKIMRLANGDTKMDSNGNMISCSIGDGIVFDKNGILTDESVSMLKKYFLPNKESDGHSDKHVQTDETKVIEPVAGKTKFMNSVFANENVQWTQMLKCMTENRIQIKKFFTERDEKNGTFVLQTPPSQKKGTIGFASINHFIHKYTADEYTTIILKRDEGKDKSPLGFYVQTSFPGLAYNPDLLTDAERKNEKTELLPESYKMRSGKERSNPKKIAKYIKMLNEDNTDLIRKTDTYKKMESIVEKTLLVFHADPKNQYTYHDLAPEYFDPNEDKTCVTTSNISDDKPEDKRFFVFVKNPDDTSIKICVRKDFMSVCKIDESKKPMPVNSRGDTIVNLHDHDIYRKSKKYQSIIDLNPAAEDTIKKLFEIVNEEIYLEKHKDDEKIKKAEKEIDSKLVKENTDEDYHEPNK